MKKKSKMIIDYLGSEKFDNHFLKPTRKVYFPPLITENTDYEYYAFDGDSIDQILFNLNKTDNGAFFQMNVSNALKLNNLKVLVNEPMVEELEIIEGVAREGYIALFAAPSKAGKSQIMIELSIAVASGTLWLNKYKCAKGNVLYINTEINKNDISKRFMDTIQAYDVDKDDVLERIWLMNLRGHSKSLDDLKNQIIEESILKNVKLIILDPIYKLQKGDENSVRDVTEFMDTAIQIGEKTHALVVLVHHYSKGSKDNVNSLDRSSGSGSFARAVDSYLDCVEINPELPDEDMIKYENTSFFRISMILRSYPNSDPIEIAYEYPKHYVVSGLEGAEIKKSGSKKQRNKLNENKLKSEKLEHAVSSVGNRVIDVANYIGVHENTISNWLKVLPDWEKKNGYLKIKEEDCFWPVYSRMVHNPIENQVYIQSDIVLIEGNYLLSKDAPWNELLPLCDDSVFLNVDTNILKERLIKRKSLSIGLNKAIHFYEQSDSKNIQYVLNSKQCPNIEIELSTR